MLQSTKWDIFSRPFVKTVRPMLSDRCLSVCLSVTLVNCGETIGWINMKLSVEVGLGPGHIVSDGDPAPPPQGDGRAGSSPKIFDPCLSWPDTWIDQDVTCMEAGLGPRDIVLDEDPARPPQKRDTAAPHFWPISIVAKQLHWMDQDATWYGGRPWSRRHCFTWET